MITFDKFKEIIVKYINFQKCEDTLRQMNIDIVESPLFETPGYFLDWLWEAYFEEDGIDTINWWMFEYHESDDFDNLGKYVGDPNKEPGMWDKDDNVIPMLTIEDLWEEVKDLRKKFVKNPKEQLKETITDMVALHLKTAAEPANLDTIKDAIGEEGWKKIASLFNDVNNLVCVDNTDEAIADIMATYLENKTPFIDADLESCHLEAFADTKVGMLLALSADDFELYVWEG